MYLKQWNHTWDEARKRANSSIREVIVRHLSNKELEFVFYNKGPVDGGIWTDGFVDEVKKEIENRVTNILLEQS